jgi:hypothetical protein
MDLTAEDPWLCVLRMQNKTSRDRSHVTAAHRENKPSALTRRQYHKKKCSCFFSMLRKSIISGSVVVAVAIVTMTMHYHPNWQHQ